ncbi:hypothetical protein AB205_0029170, partial [Aquarana catesbeiana]
SVPCLESDAAIIAFIKQKKKTTFSLQAAFILLSNSWGASVSMMRPQCSALGTRLESFWIHSGVTLTLYRSNGCVKIGLWVSVAPSHCNPIEVILMKARIALAVKICNDMHLSNRCRKIGLWVSVAPSHCNPIEVLLLKAKKIAMICTCQTGAEIFGLWVLIVPVKPIPKTFFQMKLLNTLEARQPRTPCRDSTSQKDLISDIGIRGFIAGNPGLIHFYKSPRHCNLLVSGKTALSVGMG